MKVFRVFSCKGCHMPSETEVFTVNALIVSCEPCDVSELHDLESTEMEHFEVEDHPVPKALA